VFPLRARKGGVLVRAGQTEASVDLARMAGLVPAGVICEIMNEDGTMARVPDLVPFCLEHGLKMVTVAELIRYRLQNERYIRPVAEGVLATDYGDFRMIAYESEVDGSESHVALVYGDVAGCEVATVRVHTHNLAADVFGDGRGVIDDSLRRIAEAGCGALIYLHNGTRGFAIDRGGAGRGGLQRIVLQRETRSREATERRTLRQVGLGGQILSDLGIHKIRLLTNSLTHVPALQGFGIEIVEQVAVGNPACPAGRHFVG
jgi:3,4-dihydroxy 2-butanone 4-phosphate synthase/GTP cyclohydrolase II